MYVNTGAVQVTIATPNNTTTTYKTFKSSFANTCPITVNYLNGTSGNGGFADTATRITAGLYIGTTLLLLHLMVAVIALSLFHSKQIL